MTDKLLTGFDAPILYAMYLDKPIRDHTLLQAIARINRPSEYEGRKKKYGLVVDFVGIFNSLKKALAFDSSDVADIESVLQDINLLKKRFSELMDDMKNRFLNRLEGFSKDKAIDRILEIFETESEREDLAKRYDEINDIYEILSPDPFLSKYLGDYKTLSKVYRILMEAYGNKVGKHKDLSEKTAKLVRDNSIPSNVPEIKTTYEINRKTIEELEKSNKSDREKVFNLMISLRKLIEQNISSSPYLISIGERAEKIAEKHNNNQITTVETLKYLKELAKDAENAREEE
ncbi:MAG: type I restriction endonuclease subunit R, partial [Candidatus Parvarchaeota archaeon]